MAFYYLFLKPFFLILSFCERFILEDFVLHQDKMEKGTFILKKGLAVMLKGGVIMDVVNAEQARLAEKAGAVAVMALERVPADKEKPAELQGWQTL